MTEAKRVVVTGGGTGLGAEIVSQLAAAGHDVDFTFRSSADTAAELTRTLKAAYPERRIKSVAVDLSDQVAAQVMAAHRDGFGI